MLCNSRGQRDALLTFAAGGVSVVLLKVLLAGASVTVAGRTVSLGAIDTGAIAAVLTPLLGAYTAKRISGADNPAAAPPPSQEAR
jgi:hypothetical protein